MIKLNYLLFILYCVISSKRKILIAALSLALFASAVLICTEQAGTSVGAQYDYFGDIVGGSGVYAAPDTVELPALSLGDTSIFNGNNNFTIEYGGSGDIQFNPLILISGDNEGTYTFENMTIDTSGYTGEGVQIWNGTGSGVVQFINVTFTGESPRMIDSESGSGIVVDGCTFNGSDSYLTYIFIQSGDLTLTNSQLIGSYGTGISADAAGQVSIDKCTFNGGSNSGGTYINIQSGDLTLTNSQLIGSYGTDVNANTAGLVNIDKCTFNGDSGSSGNYIYLISGDLTLSDSQLIGDYSRGIFVPETNDSAYVHIDNSYFEVTYESAIYFAYPMGGVDLSVSNCTFIGAVPQGLSNYTSVIDIELVTGSSNSIELTNSMFMGNYPSDVEAIYLNGAGTGIMTIEDCYFYGFETMAMPTVWLDSSMAFSITGTTFYENETGDYYNTTGFPILEIDDMSGQITNSTFYFNTVNGPNPQGCVFLNNSQVDMIYDTFYVNWSHDGYGNDTYASLEVAGNTSVNLINCIMDQQIDDAILYDSGNTITPPCGCIMQNDLQNVLLIGDGPDICCGPLAGCNINPSVPPMAVIALMILPGGDADGKGVNQSDLPSDVVLQQDTTWPLTDQIGAERSTDKSDIGSVVTATVFDANGGYWEGYYYDPYGDLPPSYYFLEPSPTGEQYGQLIVASYDGKTLLPSSDCAAISNANSAARFLGWSTNKNATSPDNITSAGFATGATYYAVWASSATVTFNSGGQISSVSVKYGSPVAKPTDPVLSGYEFTGWFTAPEGGTQWNFSTNITSDITLYAQWAKAFVVTYDPCNGNGTFSVNVVEGKTLAEPSVPILKNNTFNGWFTAADGGNQWDFSSPVTRDMTLYAHWNASTGDNNGDDSGFTSTDAGVLAVTIFASVISSLGILPMAFASAGLSKLSAAGLANSVSSQVGLDVSEDNIVTFNPMNGRPPWATTVTTGFMLDRPANPRAKGKVFSHWSETPNGPPFNFLTPVTFILHLYAVYNEESDGGHGNDGSHGKMRRD